MGKIMTKNPKISAQEDLHKRIDKVVSMKERLEREVVCSRTESST
jgi:hypothetical protein